MECHMEEQCNHHTNRGTRLLNMRKYTELKRNGRSPVIDNDPTWQVGGGGITNSLMTRFLSHMINLESSPFYQRRHNSLAVHVSPNFLKGPVDMSKIREMP